ncbi:hypothetical protein [Hymenobacter sp. UYP22]|uniref:hypothetical protein n=1 Tax=Hymenobacter sp. UYP22 TaxID=3156348 RepID=UPI003396A5D3
MPSEPASGRAGRPKGTKDAQPRTRATVQPDVETSAFLLRWQVFPASARPTAVALAEAVGLPVRTLHRRLSAAGRFTPEQLRQANELLDQHTPAGWIGPRQPDHLD